MYEPLLKNWYNVLVGELIGLDPSILCTQGLLIVLHIRQVVVELWKN